MAITRRDVTPLPRSSARSPKPMDDGHMFERERIHLLLIEDARRGFEDIAAGRSEDADTAIARLQSATRAPK